MRNQNDSKATAPGTGVLSAVVLIALQLGCRDGAAPNFFAEEIDLNNAWPHRDGWAWTYEVTAHQHDNLLQTTPLPDEVVFDFEHWVPPAPKLDEAWSLLEAPLTAPLNEETGEYSLFFDGAVATGPGESARRLRHEVSGNLNRVPVFLGGPVQTWVQAEDRIFGTSGDGSDASWVFLEADLSVGHQWSVPVPQVGDDAVLHAKVMARRSVQLPEGTFTDAAEVFYMLDHGIEYAWSPSNIIIGFTRRLDLGRVVFVPFRGPVAGHEKIGVFVTAEGATGGDWEIRADIAAFGR